MNGEALKQAVADLKARRNLALARAARACFCDPVTGELSDSAKRVLGDLAQHARVTGTALSLRDGQGRIDPLQLAAIEGRRELFNRLVNLLGVDRQAVHEIAETV